MAAGGLPLERATIVSFTAAAIAAANDSDLGLGASLWSSDLDRARELSAELEAGMVYINAIVASDPADKGMMFEPADSKIYRHPTFYDVPDDVGHM